MRQVANYASRAIVPVDTSSELSFAQASNLLRAWYVCNRVSPPGFVLTRNVSLVDLTMTMTALSIHHQEGSSTIWQRIWEGADGEDLVDMGPPLIRALMMNT